MATFEELMAEKARRQGMPADTFTALMQEKRRREAAPPEEEYSSVKGMSAGEKFLAGVGRGMAEFGASAANLLLPEGLTPEWASEEAIKERERLSQPLLETGWGQAGEIAGEIAAAAPIGGGIGSAARTGLTRVGAPALATSAPAIGALEGGAVGALASTPGEAGEGATFGATVGAAVPVVGQALSRTLGRGLVEMTPEAKRLKEQGIDVPLSLGAKPGVAKTFYSDIMPAIPGLRGRLMQQSDEAFEAWRENIAKQTIPEWVPKSQVDDMISKGNPQETMSRIQQFWDEEAYAALNPKKFHPSIDWAGDAGQQILQEVDPKASRWFVRELNKLAGRDGAVTGRQLMDLKRRISKRGDRTVQSNSALANDIWDTSKVIDSMIERQLQASARPNTRGAEIYRNYMANKEPYANFLDMRKAAYSSPARKAEGAFLPEDLSTASALRAGERRGTQGAGALQFPAQQAQKGLGKPIADPGFWRTIATIGLTGGAFMNPALAAASYGGLQGLSTRGAQRFLTGDLATQQALVNALNKYSGAIENIGRAGTTGLITQGAP